MRLNKYIAKSGECSRRQADNFVQGGSVTVNGILELNPAYQVLENDDVRFDGRRVKLIKESKTILLNKPIEMPQKILGNELILSIYRLSLFLHLGHLLQHIFLHIGN